MEQPPRPKDAVQKDVVPKDAFPKTITVDSGDGPRQYIAVSEVAHLLNLAKYIELKQDAERFLETHPGVQALIDRFQSPLLTAKF